jgi:hypothetical protein
MKSSAISNSSCKSRTRISAMEGVAANLTQSREALPIVDVQVGLVELIPAEIQERVLPKIRTLLEAARAPQERP